MYLADKRNTSSNESFWGSRWQNFHAIYDLVPVTFESLGLLFQGAKTLKYAIKLFIQLFNLTLLLLKQTVNIHGSHCILGTVEQQALKGN